MNPLKLATYCIWSWWAQNSSQSSVLEPSVGQIGWGSTPAWCRSSCRTLPPGQQCVQFLLWLCRSCPYTWRPGKQFLFVMSCKFCIENNHTHLTESNWLFCGFDTSVTGWDLTWPSESRRGHSNGPPGPAAAPSAHGSAYSLNLSAESTPEKRVRGMGKGRERLEAESTCVREHKTMTAASLPTRATNKFKKKKKNIFKYVLWTKTYFHQFNQSSSSFPDRLAVLTSLSTRTQFPGPTHWGSSAMRPLLR